MSRDALRKRIDELKQVIVFERRWMETHRRAFLEDQKVLRQYRQEIRELRRQARTTEA